jgi:hypothetical protein
VVEEASLIRSLLEILGLKVRVGELTIKVFYPSVLRIANTGDRREFPVVVHGLAWRESGAPSVDQRIRNDHKAKIGQTKGIIPIPPNPDGPQPRQFRVLEGHANHSTGS